VVDILKQSLAPITAEAWEEINTRARDVLKAQLSARRVVEVSGPHGWEFAAVNQGRLELGADQPEPGLYWGTRKVQPVIEVRIPFFLDQMELDSISRGTQDADLGPLEEAARKAAQFEEKAIYQGFAAGGVQGIFEASPHKHRTLTS
jgi:uncharacterized linocin/CFP29 family protein